MLARKVMIERAIAYFSDVDRLEPDPIMTHLSPDVVLEVPSHGVFTIGYDEVRSVYQNRQALVRQSWHGDFRFTADELGARLAIRLAVKRTNADGSLAELDNLTLMGFRDGLICTLAIWMSGDNTLR